MTTPDERAELIREIIDNNLASSSPQCYADFIIAKQTKLREKLLSDKFTYCSYCGEEFQIDGEDAKEKVTKHILECPKHPIADFREENAKLRGLVARAMPIMDEYLDWTNTARAMMEGRT